MIAASLLATALASLLGYFYWALDGPSWMNALGFGFTLSGVALSVGIFTWSAQTAARRVQGPVAEDTFSALALTELESAHPTNEHLTAIAERRGLGETADALRGLLVDVWRPKGAGRAARAYLLEGPDLWFVNSQAQRHKPDAGLRVERTPTGDKWKQHTKG
ncbi:hypothetical protein GCM10009821_26420 [Aeromicrobium halocynthiae]|uniref:Uncharacterized protein n=1 Tax=Aeromicrobium halocynthiae TaxID=560557 RepID=A0ABP5HQ44_9ACTN